MKLDTELTCTDMCHALPPDQVMWRKSAKLLNGQFGQCRVHEHPLYSAGLHLTIIVCCRLSALGVGVARVCGGPVASK